MKIIKNMYQKTLGYAICEGCKSVLCIQRTDRHYDIDSNGKWKAYFICSACGHKQYFMRKDLITKKKALAGDTHV